MSTVKPIPDSSSSVIPMLVCRDVAAAIDFCKTAFGGVELGRRPGEGRASGEEPILGRSHRADYGSIGARVDRRQSRRRDFVRREGAAVVEDRQGLTSSKSPRQDFLYWNDDGQLCAIRVGCIPRIG